MVTPTFSLIYTHSFVVLVFCVYDRDKIRVNHRYFFPFYIALTWRYKCQREDSSRTTYSNSFFHTKAMGFLAFEVCKQLDLCTSMTLLFVFLFYVDKNGRNYSLLDSYITWNNWLITLLSYNIRFFVTNYKYAHRNLSNTQIIMINWF